MSHLLDGQVAVVTGAESGIGEAIARCFSMEGARLACTYLSDESAAAKAQDALGTESVFLRTNVSLEHEVHSFFDRTIEELGVPTILVNCAGINEAGIHICDMDLDRWNRVLATNLTGPFLFCRRFVRELKGIVGQGKILNVTSIHEDIAFPGGGEYCASKGGLRNLTRCLALEVAPDITVNNIAPGMILTPMNEGAVENPEVRKERSAHIPLHRAGTPDEVAELAVYLASTAANYATGATFFLDGGLRLSLGQGA